MSKNAVEGLKRDGKWVFWRENGPKVGKSTEAGKRVLYLFRASGRIINLLL